MDSRILRDCQTKLGAVFWFDKTVLLLAFESDLGLKSISMPAVFAQMLLASCFVFLYAVCTIIGCVKGQNKRLRIN